LQKVGKSYDDVAATLFWGCYLPYRGVSAFLGSYVQIYLAGRLG